MGETKVLGIVMIAVLLSNCSSDDGNANTPPEAQNIQLVYQNNIVQGGTDFLVSGSVLTVKYNYYDIENDTEGNTLFKWFRSDDQNATNKELINGASQTTYTVTSADVDKYLSVEITPVQFDGKSGKTVESNYSPLVIYYRSSWDGESITTYSIVDNEFVKIFDHPVSSQYLSWQQDTIKHQEIIEQFKKIVPEKFYDRIANFTFYLGRLGDVNTLGRVSYLASERNVFDFDLAIDNAYEVPFNSELGINYTIAHEFGHVLTLNDGQASTTEFDEENCNHYFFDTCFYPNSYLNIFYKDFWVPILDEYNNATNYIAYYEGHSDEFVSEYAASQPSEDIAETLMMYVLNSVNFTGTTIADQKVKSMNNYTDFQDVRTFATTHIPNSSVRGAALFDVSKRKGFACGTKLHKH